MTTDIRITDHSLVVEPRGLDRFWSFRRRVEVPLTQVRGATHDPGVRHEPRGIRAPGLGLPHKLAGTFRHRKGKQFWNVSGFDDAVVVTLTPDAEFDRIVVSADDPAGAERAINAAARG